MQLTNLKTKILARNFKYYKEIDSTQNEIWRLVKKNKIENGTLIMADIQTAGVGTHGRKWYTDEKNNIAFSFYFKIDCYCKKLEGITIEIAKIFQDILQEKYNIKIDIKFPNDLIINNKKIGGILTETKISEEKIKYLIVGIGINTNKTTFANYIKEIATSIKNEYNLEVDNLYLISEFCNRFEKHLEKRIGVKIK